MSSEITNGIAHRLRAARKAAGYKSAKEFAVEKGIALTTYSQHESGKRGFNAELMIEYSNSLQIHPYWLLTGMGEPFLNTVSADKKLILEQECYSLPTSEKLSKNLKIEVDLLKKIFIAAESLFNNSIKLSFQELIDYCFDVYFIVSPLTADTEEKEKIIKLTISSVMQGAGIDAEKSDNKSKKLSTF